LTGNAWLQNPAKKTTIIEARTLMRRFDMSPRQFDKLRRGNLAKWERQNSAVILWFREPGGNKNYAIASGMADKPASLTSKRSKKGFVIVRLIAHFATGNRAAASVRET
jgi:hypothetical protein